MGSLLDEMLCYCTGDTIGGVCRMALERGTLAGLIGSYCTACKDDVKLLCRVVRDNPGCIHSEELLLLAIQRAVR